MDLTKQFPRSPREKAGGIAMLPRTIDKARAHLAGTLGEYIYDCSMDKALFETLGCNAEQFLQAVGVSLTDAEVLDLLVQTRIPEDKLKVHNQHIDQWHPTTPEGWDRFKEDLQKIAGGNPKVKSRTDLIDFEEGRFPGAK
ncbi:MAG TPA: DUF5069 domain-containing protein [Candidatus Eremiobacteraceae bacterium]|nr:DUF5069 domain-containing protein [Candidatus Eremiobacteraceae bacterium]